VPPIVRDDDIYHEVSSVGLEYFDDEGWSRLQPLARKPSLDRYFRQRARDARLKLWAQALSGISQTLIAVRKSTLERYDFNRKGCFRTQTPLNCSDRQATIGRDRRDSDDGMR
jgi:hypothetical protein